MADHSSCRLCARRGARHDLLGRKVAAEHFAFVIDSGFSVPHRDRRYLAVRVPLRVARLLDRLLG